MVPPEPPRNEPQQMARVNLHDIVQRQQPATPGTWAVAAVMVVLAITWVTLTITRSHHTSAMSPKPVTVPAAPR